MANGKISKQSHGHNHAICYTVAKIDMPYLCTKFDDFRFSRSINMSGAPKSFNVSYDLTTPLSGTVCHP